MFGNKFIPKALGFTDITNYYCESYYHFYLKNLPPMWKKRVNTQIFFYTCTDLCSKYTQLCLLLAIADSTRMRINFVCQICIVQMVAVSSLSRSITTGRRKNVYDPLIDQSKGLWQVCSAMILSCLLIEIFYIKKLFCAVYRV